MTKEITEIPVAKIDAIKKIAQDYLEQYPTASYAHSNQDKAQRLLDINTHADSIEHWQIIMSVYGELKDGGSLKEQLAEHIQSSFKTASAQDTFYSFVFQRGIAAPWLCNVGMRYLKNYPERIVSMFGNHTNQKPAQALIDNANRFSGRHSWVYLYCIYKLCIPNASGGMARDIRQLFINHFHDSFENIVSKLELDSYDKKSLVDPTEYDIDMQLDKNVEEELYRSQVQAMFNKKSPELGAFEEASVFWYKRKAYVRIVAAGVIIVAPAAVVLFLTANVYALLFMAIISGGGTFVLEMVGQTAIKVEQVPDDVWEFMAKQQENLGLSVIHFKDQLGEQGKQLQLRDLQIAEQGGLIGAHEKNNQEQKEQLEEQKGLLEEHEAQLAHLKANVGILQGLSAHFTEHLSLSKDQQSQLLQNLDALSSENTEIAAKALTHLSILSSENERLEENNGRLEQQVSRMEKLIGSLKELKSADLSGLKRQEQVTAFISQLAAATGVTFESVDCEPLWDAKREHEDKLHADHAPLVVAAGL